MSTWPKFFEQLGNLLCYNSKPVWSHEESGPPDMPPMVTPPESPPDSPIPPPVSTSPCADSRHRRKKRKRAGGRDDAEPDPKRRRRLDRSQAQIFMNDAHTAALKEHYANYGPGSQQCGLYLVRMLIIVLKRRRVRGDLKLPTRTTFQKYSASLNQEEADLINKMSAPGSPKMPADLPQVQSWGYKVLARALEKAGCRIPADVLENPSDREVFLNWLSNTETRAWVFRRVDKGAHWCGAVFFNENWWFIDNLAKQPELLGPGDLERKLCIDEFILGLKNNGSALLPVT